MASVFADLLAIYKTWPALSSFLKSEEGGRLRVDDYSTAENPYALIRYVKGRSDLSKPHARAFRSVVWDTLEHRPVSVTPFKSADGESVPAEGTPAEYTIETFHDGVLIGMWWDKYNQRWRIHTRSTLNANCRYYSQTTSFAEMFWGAISVIQQAALNPNKCYSWILQHPENRIVCPVKAPTLRLIQELEIAPSTLTWSPRTSDLLTRFSNWNDVYARVADWNARFGHAIQGIHITGPNGQRWKVRTAAYNTIRLTRGNTPRRDYVWLSAWRDRRLNQYLTVFPEERAGANRIVDAWKRTTSEVYNYYVDVFKARTLDRKAIPMKLRPLVFGIHGKYLEELKPQNKTVDWNVAMEYMNNRDVPQMLFVINYETRYASQGLGTIPLEPSATVGSEVTGDVDVRPPPVTIPGPNEEAKCGCEQVEACACDGCTTCAFVARGLPVPESREERLTTLEAAATDAV